MPHRYDDILNTPWPQPSRRARMDSRDRAVQFAPFAALTGFDGVIQETARLTQAPVCLFEESQELLNRELNAISRRLPGAVPVRMTIYQEDPRKAGGAFREIEGEVKKLDVGSLTLTDGREISFDQICQLERVEEEGCVRPTAGQKARCSAEDDLFRDSLVVDCKMKLDI